MWNPSSPESNVKLPLRPSVMTFFPEAIFGRQMTQRRFLWPKMPKFTEFRKNKIIVNFHAINANISIKGRKLEFGLNIVKFQYFIKDSKKWRKLSRIWVRIAAMCPTKARSSCSRLIQNFGQKASAQFWPF